MFVAKVPEHSKNVQPWCLPTVVLTGVLTGVIKEDVVPI